MLSRFLTKVSYDFPRLKYCAHYVEMAHSARRKRNIFAHFTWMRRNSPSRNWSIVLWRFFRILLPQEREPGVQIESEIHIQENFRKNVLKIETIKAAIDIQML